MWLLISHAMSVGECANCPSIEGDVRTCDAGGAKREYRLWGDELLAGYEKPKDLLGEEGHFKEKKALIERALGAERAEHLGDEMGDPAARSAAYLRDLCSGAEKRAAASP
jgi:hypothetical protein